MLDVSSSPTSVTALLQAWGDGRQDVEERLISAVQAQLSDIASRLLARERTDHTLEPQALVNEAYLLLVDQKQTAWQNRTHFYAIASRLMRRVLLDYAKGRGRIKRGGQQVRVVLRWDIGTSEKDVELEELNDALRALRSVRPHLAGVVELRFFGGLTVEETATVMSRSPRTIARDWQLAKAWLFREMTGEPDLET